MITKLLGAPSSEGTSAWSYFDATHHGPESQVLMQRARSVRGTKLKEELLRQLTAREGNKGEIRSASCDTFLMKMTQIWDRGRMGGGGGGVGKGVKGDPTYRL